MENKSILIVDDLDECLQVLEFALNTEYSPLYFAKNGSEALAIIEQQQIDLILTDYEMPGTDGKWLLERVKGIPIIVLSASLRITEQDVLSMGGRALIAKPFSMKALRLIIQKIFKEERIPHRAQ